MSAKWGWLGILGVLLMVGAGCQTSRPDLKPPQQPELFTPPPASITSNPAYPKQAFNNDEPFRRFGGNGPGNGVIPARGGPMAPGMGTTFR